jgi:hypothetical protein
MLPASERQRQQRKLSRGGGQKTCRLPGDTQVADVNIRGARQRKMGSPSAESTANAQNTTAR